MLSFFLSIQTEMEVTAITFAHHEVEIAISPWNGHQVRLQNKAGNVTLSKPILRAGKLHKDVARRPKPLSRVTVGFYLNTCFSFFAWRFIITGLSSCNYSFIFKLDKINNVCWNNRWWVWDIGKSFRSGPDLLFCRSTARVLLRDLKGAPECILI